MKTSIEKLLVIFRWSRYILIAMFLTFQSPHIVYSQASGLGGGKQRISRSD